MRAWAVLLGVGMVLALGEARAQAARVESRVSDPERLAPFGLMLDAGVTEGTGLSMAVQPSPGVRLHLGATSNGIRVGGRVGLTLLPLRTRVQPTLSLEFGHALPGDVDALVRRLADRTQPPAPALERVGYTYGSAHLGFELGMARRFTFYARGGASVVALRVPNLESLPEPFRHVLGQREARGGTCYGVRPSLKLGLVAWFG
jgi:hypothetical protein